jgi:acetyltransferase
MSRYHDLRTRERFDPPEFDVNRNAASAIVSQYEGKDAYLPQADAFDVLAAYGVPVPKVARVTGKGDLGEAAGKVGFPCVLKVDAGDVIHKSDEGGVKLGIEDEAALEEAFTAMEDRFSGKAGSYVLMEQKDPGREVIVGVTEAPGLGSLVMFGLGGIFVEVMKDVTFAVAPLNMPETYEMVRAIKGFPVLEGVRGEQGVDLEALRELLARVSRLAADFPSIVEMDLNPIFTYPAGTAPSAVDVRMKVR